MKVHRHRRSLVGPVILIGLGMIFLMDNLGLLDRTVWALLGTVWPLLLVAIGLDLLFGRRSGGAVEATVEGGSTRYM
jgi:hypothetical protein